MWLTKDDLPKSIIVDNVAYAVESDFRNWITFESIMIDSNFEDRLKPYFMINTVFKGNTDLSKSDSILQSLFSFYRLNKPINGYSSNRAELGYRYDYDMDLILAAFRQQYNIDLLSANMHWWEFSSYFRGLSKDTKFIEVVGYRTADLSKMPKEQKKHYEDLKRFYALPVSDKKIRTQEEIEKDILKSLKVGG